jgi:hypothetical protein
MKSQVKVFQWMTQFKNKNMKHKKEEAVQKI